MAKDWKNIHPNFTLELQKEWEELGFNYKEAEEWINIVDLNLKPANAKFVAYLKFKGHNSSEQYLNQDKLRLEFTNWLRNEKNAQDYLNCFFYPKEKKIKVKELDISNKNLEGDLDLSEFINLEKLKCQYNQLTGLSLNGLNHLERVNCTNNKLTNLDLTDCKNLQSINASNNQLSNTGFLLQLYSPKRLKCLYLDNNNISSSLEIFTQFVNLEILSLGTYKKLSKEKKDNNFFGSLEPLKDLNRLKKIDISNTDIENGIEYLPKKLEEICCSSKERPESKVKNIHLNFDSKLQKQWKDSGFNWKQINDWIRSGLQPKDYDLAIYLKSNPQDITKELVDKYTWRNIHQDFTYSKKKKWEEQGFNWQQTKKWIEVGFNPNDSCYIESWRKQGFTLVQIERWIKIGLQVNNAEYAGWLRNIKKINIEFMSFGQQSLIKELILNEDLKKRYYDFGLCNRCKEPNGGWDSFHNKYWCQSCNLEKFKQDFKKLTDNNQNINRIIEEISKWIPHDSLENVKYLTKGGFGKVYKAEWVENKGLSGWKVDKNNHYWEGYGNKIVVLKSLNNSQGVDEKFLQEFAYYKLLKGPRIVELHGISQDPKTGNYLMVMDYKEGGNLRQYLQENYVKLDSKDKLHHLWTIASGLNSIHEKGLVHRDFHAGNILNGTIGGMNSCCITDFGLSRPADEENESKVYGVLPYVAPEVLAGEKYTQASDVYSFGIVAYEVLSGLSPYYDMAHEKFLAVKICKGLRPNLNNIKVPESLKNLIRRCWDAEPSKRPSSSELDETLWKWWDEIDELNSEIYNQYKEVESEKTKEREFEKISDPIPQDDCVKERETFCSPFSLLRRLFLSPNTNLEEREHSTKIFTYQTHPQAIYTSRLLDFKGLPRPQNSQLINEQFYNLKNNLQSKSSELSRQLTDTIKLAREIKTNEDWENLAKIELKKREKFKKALKSLLEKSEELERVIADDPLISEETQQLLKEVREIKKLQVKSEEFQAKLEKEKNQKEQELDELKKLIVVNKPRVESDLEELLKAQEKNIPEWLKSCKKRLANLITNEELNNLCKKQEEIIKLEIKLKKVANQQENQVTQIINFINNQGIISEGNVTIEGNFLSQNNTINQTNEELQTQIIDISKNN